MKCFRFPVLRDTGRVVFAIMFAVGVWGLVACGGSSSKNGGAGEPSAFVFNPDTALDAAFLVADIIDVFPGLSAVNDAVLGLVEGGADDADLSDDFCAPGGIAILNANQPFGPGAAATLTLTNCIDGSLGGTVQYDFTEVAATPNPFVDANVTLNLSGTVDGVVQRTEAEFSFRAFRDPSARGFDYFGRDSYWFLTEDGETTKNACFNVNLRLSDSIVEFTRSEIVIVNAQNRLFTVRGQGSPSLIFDDEEILIGGSGLQFVSEVSRLDGYCKVVGAPDGITPGNTGINLVVDPDVRDGVILSGTIKTTWGEILD